MKSESFMYGMMPYMSNSIHSDCPYTSDSFYGATLAYSYVPYQRGGALYTECEALKQGTVFPALNKPLNVYGLEFCTSCKEEEN